MSLQWPSVAFSETLLIFSCAKRFTSSPSWLSLPVLASCGLLGFLHSLLISSWLLALPLKLFKALLPDTRHTTWLTITDLTGRFGKAPARKPQHVQLDHYKSKKGSSKMLLPVMRNYKSRPEAPISMLNSFLFIHYY